MTSADSFWSLTEGGVITSDERAVEVIRRCSSNKIFKQVLGKIGSVVEYARRVQPSNPLFIEGKFRPEPGIEMQYHGIPSRVVKVDIKVDNEKGRWLVGSHFYLIVSTSGRIVGVSNILA